MLKLEKSTKKPNKITSSNTASHKNSKCIDFPQQRLSYTGVIITIKFVQFLYNFFYSIDIWYSTLSFIHMNLKIIENTYLLCGLTCNGFPVAQYKTLSYFMWSKFSYWTTGVRFVLISVDSLTQKNCGRFFFLSYHNSF